MDNRGKSNSDYSQIYINVFGWRSSLQTLFIVQISLRQLAMGICDLNWNLGFLEVMCNQGFLELNPLHL